MRLLRVIVLWALLAGAPLLGWGGEAPAANREAESAPAAPAGPPEHGLTPQAVEITRLQTPLGPLPITNSMLVSWLVAGGLIVFARVAMRKMKAVPEGAQNFWECMVESLYEFLEGIIGAGLVKRTFWFFASVFIFILFCNWAGLLPGVGSVGFGHGTAAGFVVDRPLFRGANADLNMTGAMAMVFFACWVCWALKSNGPIGFLGHLFAPKGETTGWLKPLMVVVFFAVGWLEVISILFRPLSLSFRLYGNIFAGENMLEAMSDLLKHPPWARAAASVVVPVPFYFLELLVGFIQALVFMLLTAVFTMLICEQEEGHGAPLGAAEPQPKSGENSLVREATGALGRRLPGGRPARSGGAPRRGEVLSKGLRRIGGRSWRSASILMASEILRGSRGLRF